MRVGHIHQPIGSENYRTNPNLSAAVPVVKLRKRGIASNLLFWFVAQKVSILMNLLPNLAVLSLLATGLASAAGGDVDIFTAKDLQAESQKLSKKGSQFVSQELKRYGNHYTMVAHREKTGSSELHEHEADIFVVEEGEATILTGGKLVNAKTEKSGELRGTSLSGAERHTLSTGDIIHIPA